MEELRFLFTDVLAKKADGPSEGCVNPDEGCFGTVFRDKDTGKEYLIEDGMEKRGLITHYKLYSIQEIERRPKGQREFTEAEFKRLVKLIPPEPGADAAMVAQFMTVNTGHQFAFDDERRREGVTARAAAKPGGELTKG